MKIDWYVKRHWYRKDLWRNLKATLKLGKWKEKRMIDHAQAKIELISAAINAAEQTNVKAGKPLEAHELAAFSLLRIAARQYKETKQPKRVDEGDDFDSLHGCG